MKNILKIKHILFLLIIYAFNSCAGIFTKLASMQQFLSIDYLIYLSFAILILFFYAIFWQQILKVVDLSVAYMFKSLGVVYVLLIGYCIFNENITISNIIGSIIIILGVILYFKN